MLLFCLGTKKEKLSFVEQKDDGTQTDEVQAFIYGRTTCAMSACWRFFGYQTYPPTRPSVFLLDVILPSQIQHQDTKDQCCQLSVYLNRPRLPEFDNLKYTDFFTHWTFAKKPPPATRQDVHIIDYIPQRSPYYVFKLVRADARLVRMQYMPFGSGEIWYLRLLLYNVACRTLDELKNGFSTFQEGAKSRGLLMEGRDVEVALHEALTFGTPGEVRSLFVQLTLEAYPTLNCYNTDVELRAKLFEGYPPRSREEIRRPQLALPAAESEELRQQTQDIAEKCFLNYLAVQFRRFNKSNEDFGFPKCSETLETELQEYRKHYSRDAAILELQRLRQMEPNNVAQERFYERITGAIRAKETMLVFLQGQGGSGKSSVAKKIIQFTRSIGLIALGCASTGLACQVYPNGEFVTAHSLFGIPVFESDNDFDDIGEAYQSNLSLKKNEGKLELLMAASVIIWDEFLR